jgi:hypothetical protein
MGFVGLSMPLMFGDDDESDSGGHRLLTSAGDDHHDDDDDAVAPGLLILHILVVSVLMTLGKMFPVCCYRNEAGWRTRLALSLGMCPRGEVGAGVIVISIAMGISGPAITIAVMALTINLVMSSGFIAAVVKLSNNDPDSPDKTRMSPLSPLDTGSIKGDWSRDDKHADNFEDSKIDVDEPSTPKLDENAPTQWTSILVNQKDVLTCVDLSSPTQLKPGKAKCSERLRNFLTRIGLEHLEPTFIAEEVEYSMLLSLPQEELKDVLKEMGLTVGARIKIVQALEGSHDDSCTADGCGAGVQVVLF